jgi:hypothetical protein
LRPSAPVLTDSLGITQFAVARVSSVTGLALGGGFTLAVRTGDGWGVEGLDLQFTESLDRPNMEAHVSIPVAGVWTLGDGLWDGLYIRWGVFDLGVGNQGLFFGSNAGVGYDLPLGDRFVWRLLELRGFAGGRLEDDRGMFDGGATASVGLTVK